MTDLTPAEILAELRDIHVPQADTGAATTVLAPEPLAVLVLALAALAGVRWWRRTRWRRDAPARTRPDRPVGPGPLPVGCDDRAAGPHGATPSGHHAAGRDLAAAGPGRGR